MKCTADTLISNFDSTAVPVNTFCGLKRFDFGSKQATERRFSVIYQQITGITVNTFFQKTLGATILFHLPNGSLTSVTADKSVVMKVQK